MRDSGVKVVEPNYSHLSAAFTPALYFELSKDRKKKLLLISGEMTLSLFTSFLGFHVFLSPLSICVCFIPQIIL